MKLSEKKDRAGVERLLRLADEKGVLRTTTDKHQLNLLSDNRCATRACVWALGVSASRVVIVLG